MIDILQLHNPHSAILSAVIFNAIIIALMIPLALRGVKIQAMGATARLRQNLLIYGLGGLITPFVLIKLIDLAVVGPLGALMFRTMWRQLTTSLILTAIVAVVIGIIYPETFPGRARDAWCTVAGRSA